MKSSAGILVLLSLLGALTFASCRGGDFPEPVPGETVKDPGTQDTQDPENPENPGNQGNPGSTDTVPLLPQYKKVNTFPTIYITTDDGRPVTSKTVYKCGKIRFEDPEGMYSDSTVTESAMQVRGRGNTTWGYDKKPYRIKLDSKHHVFGMRSDKDWVLLAEYKDHSLLHNTVAFQLARLAGMPWTPECRAADVYFNGSYAGCYTLVEHKETGKHKVDIDPGAGEFYLEIDDKDDDDVRFRTPKYYKVVKFHDPDLPDDGQFARVQDFFSEVETVLASSSFADPETGYRKYLDVPSFARFFIVEELVKNVDGNFRLSTYLSLGKDGKLTMAHIWDTDLAFGTTDIYTQYGYGCWNTGITGERYDVDDSPTGWYVKICGGRPLGWEDPNGQTSWFQRMFLDPAFVEDVKAEWNACREKFGSIPDYIDALYDFNSASYARNSDRWTSNSYWGEDFSDYASAKDEMKKFYSKRLSWMDGAINSL